MLTESASPPPELHESGEEVEFAGAGSLICVGCRFALSIDALESLPTCPACGGTQFRRASIFDQPTMDAGAVSVAPKPPAWLHEARADIAGSEGCYLAYEEDGELKTLPIEEGWTRIGRSGAADLRLDDPTVSRRHALVVLTPEGDLRALDDRSLNGLFVNGERVEWAPLSDGDELEIGRYRLYVLEA
jgi:FHA domain/Zinc-ribbon containing domain